MSGGASARPWQLEDDLRWITCRSPRGRLLYSEPVERLGNRHDLLDCLGHLAKKPGVTDADLGNLVRFLDGLLDFATLTPRACPTFDVRARIAEVQRRRERRSA